MFKHSIVADFACGQENVNNSILEGIFMDPEIKNCINIVDNKITASFGNPGEEINITLGLPKEMV